MKKSSLPILPILGIGGVVLIALAASKGSSSSNGTTESSGDGDGDDQLPPDGEIPGEDEEGEREPLPSATPSLQGPAAQATPNLENFSICTGRELSPTGKDVYTEYAIPTELETVPLLHGNVIAGSDYVGTASDTKKLYYKYRIDPAAHLTLQEQGANRFKKALQGEAGACPINPSARMLAEESPYSLIISTIAPPQMNHPTLWWTGLFAYVAQAAAELEDVKGVRAVAAVPTVDFGNLVRGRAHQHGGTRVILQPKYYLHQGIHVGYQTGYRDEDPYPVDEKELNAMYWSYSERMFWSGLGPALGIEAGAEGNKLLSKAMSGSIFTSPFGSGSDEEPAFKTTVVCAVNRIHNVARMLIFAPQKTSEVQGRVSLVNPNDVPSPDAAKKMVAELTQWALDYEPPKTPTTSPLQMK